MLHRLRLHNFKTFLNADIDFSRRHLVIGRNNSGKTNLTSALRFLSALASNSLDEAVSVVPGGHSELCNWKLRSNQLEIACDCSLEIGGEVCQFTYQIRLQRSSNEGMTIPSLPSLSIQEERLTCTSPKLKTVQLLANDGHESHLLHELQAEQNGNPHRARVLSPEGSTMLSKIYELDTNRRAILFRTFLQRFAYYSFSPWMMRFSNVREWTPYAVLDSVGQQLRSAIFHLKNSDERRYRRVIQHAQIVEPNLHAVNFVAAGQLPVAFVDLEDHRNAAWTGLSDGTLRVLALAVVIEQASALSPPLGAVPTLSLIEEPENGIYPGQLRKIFDLFEEWAPASQFLFTSHSPYFIDMFDSRRDSVSLLRKAGDRTQIDRPAAENPEDEERFTLSTEFASELWE